MRLLLTVIATWFGLELLGMVTLFILAAREERHQARDAVVARHLLGAR